MIFEVGCVADISDEALRELSVTMVAKIKEAKKKVAQALKKDKSLMHAWVSRLSADPPKALPEEVLEIRNQRKREFELALLSNPDAFIAFQVSTFLVSLGEELRQERGRRAPPPKKITS